MMPQSTGPVRPCRKKVALSERLRSVYLTRPLLYALRISGLTENGRRWSMASAAASSPSQLAPMEAPVTMLTLKGCPASCSLRALAAMAGGMVLGAPAGPKPPTPIHSPWLMNAAASAADISGIFIIYAVLDCKYTNIFSIPLYYYSLFKLHFPRKNTGTSGRPNALSIKNGQEILSIRIEIA